MKKILSRKAVRRIDAATIAAGTPSIDLMERAAVAFVQAFKSLYRGSKIVVVCGPGNNGGDGLAIARLLNAEGFDVNVFYLGRDRYSDDFNVNLARLHETAVPCQRVDDSSALPTLSEGSLLIDALFGTGLNKPLTGSAAHVVRWMNHQPATRVSVDVPSGMTETPDAADETPVLADHVVAFQIHRAELLMPRENFNPLSVRVVDIGLDERAIDAEQTGYFLIEESDVRSMLKTRRMFDHKWTYGHALIVAGSRRTLGAALLATGACLRSGCGLVTTHTVKTGAAALNALHPEAMFSPDAHDEMITDVDLKTHYTAIGIGCGVGRSAEAERAVVNVLTRSNVPLVLDADALNILSGEHGWKKLVPEGSVLTPHQKEFDRLTGEHANDRERLLAQTALAQGLNAVVVVKGAYTRVALPNGVCYFNSTGTPALATAGMGDVLTGLVTGLVARGYGPADAAAIGVYVHGLAAQLAEEKLGVESVTATDVSNHLSRAFNRLCA